MLDTFLNSALIILAYASLWYVISLLVKRNDIADIAWGLGYILLCLFYFLTNEHSTRTLILYGLVMIWGLRLAIHIYLRNRGKKEDFRYLAWRQEWGRAWRRYELLEIGNSPGAACGLWKNSGKVSLWITWESLYGLSDSIFKLWETINWSSLKRIPQIREK